MFFIFYKSSRTLHGHDTGLELTYYLTRKVYIYIAGIFPTLAMTFGKCPRRAPGTYLSTVHKSPVLVPTLTANHYRLYNHETPRSF